MLSLDNILINYLIGFLFLFFGQYFYWLFLIVVIFLFNINLSDYLLTTLPKWFITIGKRFGLLFAGIEGFFSGQEVSARFFYNNPEWIVFIICSLLIIAGMIAAVLLRHKSSLIIGVLSGGLIAAKMYMHFFHGEGLFVLFVLITGGIIGGILFDMTFDFALIAFTSLLGSMFLVTPFYDGTLISNVSLFFIAYIGFCFQGFITKKKDLLKSSRLHKRNKRIF